MIEIFSSVSSSVGRSGRHFEGDTFFWTDNIALGEESEKKISDKLHPKDLFFRVDHQTFRKLPRTKAIIFGVSVTSVLETRYV